MKGNFLKNNIKKYLLLRNNKGDEVESWYTCLGHKPLHKLCFYSGGIRTLVAMATYIFHRLIMGKVYPLHKLCFCFVQVRTGCYGIFFHFVVIPGQYSGEHL